MVFVPTYRKMTPSELRERVARAWDILKKCRLCPRNCGVDRTAGEKGFCRTADMPFVSSWGPHLGEERPLVGAGGSGTIFFGNCNLGCIFCQNWTISHRGDGREMSPEKLAHVMLDLQESGCHNINLVTPTHQTPMILRAVMFAVEGGLDVPIVYNCGGYESLESLSILDGIIDIYMPDFKYADPAVGMEYSKVPDYPQRAKEAIREMHRQVGDLVDDEYGVAVRGLLVRHLVLPSGRAGTAEVVRFIAEEISRDTYINIMDQYHPCFKAFGHPPLDRRITSAEYREAINLAIRQGLTRIDGVTV